MKNILRSGWVIFCLAVMVVYLASCLTPFINPQKFSRLSILGLVFPLVFIAAFICCLTLLFIYKKTAIVLMVIILAAGFKSLSNTLALNPGKWKMNKQAGSLRVLSWNVANWVNALRQTYPEAKPRIEMLKSIATYSPDIICAQEYIDVDDNDWHIYASAKKELDSMGYKYCYESNDSIITRYHKVRIVDGSAIFSRFPLLDSGRINIVNTGKSENLIYADINYNNKRVRIFTTHLLSLGLYSDTLPEKGNNNLYKIAYQRKRNIAYKMRERETEHKKEIDIIRKAMAQSPCPVIYCGDINATPASYTYNYLKGDLQDAFLEKGFGLGGTFYKLPSTVRIDVCLPDKNFKVLQFTVPQLYLSDHFPIVADVKWR